MLFPTLLLLFGFSSNRWFPSLCFSLSVTFYFFISLILLGYYFVFLFFCFFSCGLALLLMYLACNLFSVLVCSLILVRSVLHLASSLLSVSCIVGFANKMFNIHSKVKFFFCFPLIFLLASPSFHPVSYVLNGLQHGFGLGFQLSGRLKYSKACWLT